MLHPTSPHTGSESTPPPPPPRPFEIPAAATATIRSPRHRRRHRDHSKSSPPPHHDHRRTTRPGARGGRVWAVVDACRRSNRVVESARGSGCRQTTRACRRRARARQGGRGARRECRPPPRAGAEGARGCGGIARACVRGAREESPADPDGRRGPPKRENARAVGRAHRRRPPSPEEKELLRCSTWDEASARRLCRERRARTRHTRRAASPVGRCSPTCDLSLVLPLDDARLARGRIAQDKNLDHVVA